MRVFRAVVAGRSMLPTLSPGDRVVAFGAARVRRGDVWVVRLGDGYVVKRVVGLPWDRVRVTDGRARVAESSSAAGRAGPQADGSWVLGPDEYLVEGDNERETTDLRAFGPMGPESLVGRVVFRSWPRPGPVR